MRLEYYTPLKKGFILQSKDAHFKKIRRRATRGAIFFSSASRGEARPLHFKFASYAYVWDKPMYTRPLLDFSERGLDTRLAQTYFFGEGASAILEYSFSSLDGVVNWSKLDSSKLKFDPRKQRKGRAWERRYKSYR